MAGGLRSIVSYRTHRITEAGDRLAAGAWDYIERIEVTDRREYEQGCCHENQPGTKRGSLSGGSQVATTACCHCSAASVLKLRRVDLEIR